MKVLQYLQKVQYWILLKSKYDVVSKKAGSRSGVLERTGQRKSSAHCYTPLGVVFQFSAQGRRERGGGMERKGRKGVEKTKDGNQ